MLIGSDYDGLGNTLPVGLKMSVSQSDLSFVEARLLRRRR